LSNKHLKLLNNTLRVALAPRPLPESRT